MAALKPGEGVAWWWSRATGWAPEITLLGCNGDKGLQAVTLTLSR